MNIDLLMRSACRFHLRSPLQLLLNVAGIALGVAVFIGVDVANTSANSAFESSAAFVRGAATHRLLPIGDGLDENIFFRDIAARGLRGAPIIEVPVRIGNDGPTATLLGVDPIEEASFRDVTRAGLLGGSASDRLISEPLTALVSPALPVSEDADTISIATQSGARQLLVAGMLPRDAGITQLIIVDIATAQEILGMTGRLSRIDLILDATREAELRQRLPAGTVLVSADNEDPAFRELSRAFRINILALGFLALAVGMFLVYSSTNFSLVRRAPVFATLHIVGADTRQLAIAMTTEFMLLGLVSSAIGVALGHALADLLVDLMLFTIDDFAFRSNVAVASASPWLYARGLATGLAATLLATVGPIRSAVQRNTSSSLYRSTLEARSQTRSALGLRAGGVLLLLGIALLLAPTRSLAVAFAGLFAVLAAAACSVPAAASALLRLLLVPLGRFLGLSGIQAARNVLANQSRIAIATSALTLAVACVIGVGIMISSFRASLQQWLDTTLTADIYVNLTGGDSAASTLAAQLRSDTRIETLSLTRLAAFATESGLIRVRAFEPGRRGWGLQIVADSGTETIELLESGHGIAITEPFALRSGLGVGDTLQLPGLIGTHVFPIVAISRNYDAGSPGVLMSLEKFRQVSSDNRIDGIGIELRDPAAASDMALEMRRLPQFRDARITTSSGIKGLSLEVFDRTFLITEVLRFLAGGIAFLGMLSALMAVQIARQREFGILRAIGFAPSNLWRLIMTETAIIGANAGLLAMPVGVLLAALLIYVINVRSFGWTMELQLMPASLIPGLALAVSAAALAGVLPALRSYARPVGDALREG